ncbi:MAG TPA: ABC transporter permease [Ktedonobacteraceae bacterium]
MAEAIKDTPTTSTPASSVLARAQQWSRTFWGKWLIRILFYGLLIAIWQLLFSSGFWQDFILPSPAEVSSSLVTGFQSNFYLQSMLASLQRLGIGYSIALVLGLILGLLIGRFNLLKETVGSLVLGLQGLPSICWLPLAVLWFGLNDQAIIFVVIMGALFSIALGVDAGVRNMPPVYLKAARNLGTRGFALYKDVIFPAAFPTIVSGLKQGWSFAWRSLMAGELLYNTVSLGNLLETGRDLLDSAQVISVMLLIIFIGVAIDALIFGPLERVTRARWGLTG